MSVVEVTVGSQTWAASNLAISQFSNGVEIPVVNNFSDWARMAEKGLPCCAMLNNKKSTAKFGFFYNGFCVDSKNGICPDGWRVPTIQDILRLTDYLNKPSTAEHQLYYNGTVAQGLKGTKSWKKTFFGEPGNNSTSLNFLGGGSLTARDGLFVFDDKGLTSEHWLKDEHVASPDRKYFPPHREDWPQDRKYTFSIGNGGDHSLTINSDWSTQACFIRLIKNEL